MTFQLAQREEYKNGVFWSFFGIFNSLHVILHKSPIDVLCFSIDVNSLFSDILSAMPLTYNNTHQLLYARMRSQSLIYLKAYQKASLDGKAT